MLPQSVQRVYHRPLRGAFAARVDGPIVPGDRSPTQPPSSPRYSDSAGRCHAEESGGVPRRTNRCASRLGDGRRPRRSRSLVRMFCRGSRRCLRTCTIAVGQSAPGLVVAALLARSALPLATYMRLALTTFSYCAYWGTRRGGDGNHPPDSRGDPVAGIRPRAATHLKGDKTKLCEPAQGIANRRLVDRGELGKLLVRSEELDPGVQVRAASRVDTPLRRRRSPSASDSS